MLAFKLDHKYSDNNLSMENLKGKDLNRARQLKQACVNKEIPFYLANMERRVFGEGEGGDADYYYDGYGDDYSDDHSDDDINEYRGSGDFHPIDEVYDDDLELTRVVNANGVEIVKGVELAERNMIQAEVFKGSLPDEERDYTGFTGNEGVSTIHFYRETVSRMLISDRMFEPLLTSDARSL